MKKDPFERVIARESRLRRRTSELETREGAIRMALRWFAALALGWAGLLAVHWLVLGDPQWLVVLHTMVFALVVGYWSAAGLFASRMFSENDNSIWLHVMA